jgi:hypothetical protein
MFFFFFFNCQKRERDEIKTVVPKSIQIRYTAVAVAKSDYVKAILHIYKNKLCSEILKANILFGPSEKKGGNYGGASCCLSTFLSRSPHS